MSSNRIAGEAATNGVALGPWAAGRCRRRIHLDYDPTADRSRRIAPDDGARLRISDLAAHRDRVRELLATYLPLVADWSATGTDRPEAIWAPPLRSGDRFAAPDLLLRADDGGYLPVIVAGHRTMDPGAGAICSDLASPLAESTSPSRKPRAHHADVLALAHIYRLLQDLGLASGVARGGVIGRGGPAADPQWDDGALILWHELGAAALQDYDSRFADRLAVAQAAAARREPLARPSRVAECRRCPWWSVCREELVAAHDVSLLVAGADVAVLHEVGVATYDDVARMDPAVLAGLRLTGIPPGDARSRALAMIAGVPLIRRRGRVDVPRADVELDVDMESYLDDGAYLWGTYLTGAPIDGFAPGYRPFVTWEPLRSPAAATNFVSFWHFLGALRRACAKGGLTFAAYCYSRKAEERWLYGTPQRFPGVAGMPDRSDVAGFCSSPQWVDLYAEMKRLFVVPGSLRLKVIATVAGFSWRDDEPGGENSMAWYRIATGVDQAVGGSAARGAVDIVTAHRTRILRYNEDDVLATLALRRWICERSDEVPTVDDLSRDRVAGG